MNRNKKVLVVLLVLMGLVGLFAVGIHGALRGNPLGADFYTFWKAARAEFIEGRSAYDPSVAGEIQMDLQGRLSTPSEDQFAFSYPIFALLLVAPVSWLPFEWAQAIWMAFNFILVLTAGMALSPRPRRWVGVTFWAFYPVSFALILGNFDLPVAVIWLFFFSQVLVNRESRSVDTYWMGALVAITTVKPQLSWLFLIFAAAVALRQKYTKLTLGFLAGCLLLWSVGFLWHPHWFSDWLSQAMQYLNVVTGHSSPLRHLLALLPEPFNQIVQWIVWATLAGTTLFLFGKAWRDDSFSIKFLGWCGIVIYVVHPTGLSYEQMAFLIAVFLWAVTERSTGRVVATWLGMIVLSWVSLAATLTRIDPLANSSWLFIVAIAWLIWISLTKKSTHQPVQ